MGRRVKPPRGAPSSSSGSGRRRRWKVIFIVSALAWFSAEAGVAYRLGQASSGAARPEALAWLDFADEAQRSGLLFHHSMGGPEKEYLLECMGSGAALLDHDCDGDLDVYLVNGSRFDAPAGSPRPRSTLFANEGRLRFREVTEAAGVGQDGWGFGCAAADYDNDGDTDLLVLNWGPDRLYRNEGGVFRDVAREAGLDDPGWGVSAVFLDFDRDGFLDLFVTRYMEFDRQRIPTPRRDPTCHFKGVPAPCGPVGLPAAHDRLYRNRGDGTFEDISARAGLHSVPPAYGLAVASLDWEEDGWPDIYVANDLTPNHLWINQRDGTFREAAFELGAALSEDGRAQAGMGIAVGDVRGVGREDLLVTNYEDETNAYYANQGRHFTVLTAPLGLAGPSFKALGWAALFLDADLDGDLDLFVANGHVFPQSDRVASSPGFRQQSQLFENTGRGFRDARASAGPAFLEKRSARGAAAGDLDGDGDLDLVVTSLDGEAALLVNRGPPRGRWLGVRAVGTRSNRDGMGARLVVSTPLGLQVRWVRQGMGYASSSETTARFGLGREVTVEFLQVLWPSGLEERFEVGEVNRVVTCVEGGGRAVVGRGR